MITPFSPPIGDTIALSDDPGVDLGVGPCAKQVVTATVIAVDGTRFVATNHCDRPQRTCPRAGLPTGIGYELCRSICGQRGHAEINALRLAGARAAGGHLIVSGHSYICDACLGAADRAGIRTMEID